MRVYYSHYFSKIVYLIFILNIILIRYLIFYVLLKNPVTTTMHTVARLTNVNTLLSKDDSRIPHAINTKINSYNNLNIGIEFKYFHRLLLNDYYTDHKYYLLMKLYVSIVFICVRIKI